MTKKIHLKLPRKISAVLLLSFSISLFPLSASASAITETNVFNATNSERSSYGVLGASWNYKLAQAARAKAQDMIDRDYFSHTTPDGRSPWSFITATGYNYVYAGENLAMNFTDTESIMAAWMSSGGHRANILGGQFKELGVGVVVGEFQGYTTTMVVQMFGTQATQVYGERKSGGGSSGSKSNPSSPAPAIDYSALIINSSNLVKRRIEDFQKSSVYLIKIVKREQEGP